MSEPLPVCASLDEGVHNMATLAAVVSSAQNNGARVTV